MGFAYVLPLAPPKVPLVAIIMIIINNGSPVAHARPACGWVEALSQLILRTALGTKDFIITFSKEEEGRLTSG